jgi:hypothetical protein
VDEVIVMTPHEAIAQRGRSSKFRRGVRWMFVNRRTGGLTVAQWPNVTLSVSFALSTARRFHYPKGGTPATTLHVLGAVATIVWAVDELVRGVNPFRRILGSVVLLTTMSSIGLLAR